MKLRIDGMSCRHCKSAVEQTIKDVTGVEGVDVSLEGVAVVRGNPSPDELVEAVREAGYEAKVEA